MTGEVVWCTYQRCTNMVKKKRKFEWDAGNVIHLWESHKVRPFEAEEAMNDPHSLQDVDENHSEFEPRFTVIGRTRKHRILFLAFTLRNSHIRIFHGRDVTRKEANTYEEKISATKV